MTTRTGTRPPVVFRPVLAVLDRLRTAPRLGAVLAVLLLPALLASGVHATNMATYLQQTHASREAAGTAGALLTTMAQAAAGSYGTTTGDDRVAEVVGLSEDVGRVADEGRLRESPLAPAGALARVTADVLPDAVVALTRLADAAGPPGAGGERAMAAGEVRAAAWRLRDHAGEAVRPAAGPTVAELAPLESVARALTAAAATGGDGRASRDDVIAAVRAAAGEVAAAVQPTVTTLDRLLQEQAAVLRTVLIVSVSALGTGVLAAVWVAGATLWRTRTDVGQLVRAVRALADGDDGASPPMPDRQDELGDLARAVTATRHRLADAHEQLVRKETERERLHRTAIVRRLLLERLLAVQRAIATREPLAKVLDMVSRAASEVLDDVVVGIVLTGDGPPDGAPERVDGGAAGRARPAAAFGAVDERCDAALLEAGQAAVAAGHPVVATIVDPAPNPGRAGARARVVSVPVQLAGTVSGAIVAILPIGDDDADPRIDLLHAFAQQVSLALADARSAEQVHEARHDSLTGLPTRTLFLERMTLELAATRARGDDVALLFVDLDRFKSVNDTMGHQAGDELLAAVAERIVGCLRSSDTAARLGGDEFAALLPGASVASATRVAQRIIEVLRRPFVVSGTQVAIDSSVGVAAPADECRESNPDRDPDPDRGLADAAAALLSSADVAMYRAKKSGGGHVVVFEPRMHEEAVERLRVVTDMRQAVTQGEFSLAYQPLVRLENGATAGVEALLRWQHPRRGPVSPGEFIPVAEETGVIAELGRWVLLESLRSFGRWVDVVPDLQLNVNVSGRQLSDPGFVGDVAAALAAAGVRPGALTLELTESVLINDPQNIPRQLERLKRLGVRLAVDDFGTGYSSLAYLRRLPVDDVKIDREFVAGLGHDPRDLAVVKTVLDLATTLRLRAVAEGIEHPGQVEVLRRLGCALGQGFLLGRPMRTEQITGLLAVSAVPGARSGRADDDTALRPVLPSGPPPG